MRAFPDPARSLAGLKSGSMVFRWTPRNEGPWRSSVAGKQRLMRSTSELTSVRRVSIEATVCVLLSGRWTCGQGVCAPSNCKPDALRSVTEKFMWLHKNVADAAGRTKEDPVRCVCVAVAVAVNLTVCGCPWANGCVCVCVSV